MPASNPYSGYRRPQRKETRFHQVLHEAKEQVSLLEYERDCLNRELDMWRKYSLSLYHEYLKVIGKLEEAGKAR
ncbi:hypothetical protein N7450_011394 [Penicillium hetheringtonii]|uniref:Uncharacterized protein n=1 Tax=Penicillium hetheringtonii TaxID=911720 RepID=A0AAD6GLS8_9EURO|nr:hypothetical protein N7450_011394 [Penicillium hetheringtonii]